jgi:predicted phage-related endonuclease
MGSTPKGISASRAAAVLGLSEFSTPVQAWLEIEEELHPGFAAEHGYAPSAREESAAMRWGTAFESAVIELAERERNNGIKIIDREGEYAVGLDGKINRKDRAKNVVTCHVDGKYTLAAGGYTNTLHEGKTTSVFTFREKWGAPGTDHVPQGYYCQAQHQMICTGAEQVIVSALVFPETPDAMEKNGLCVIQQKDGEYTIGNEKWGIRRDCSDIADMLSFLGFFHQYTVPAKPSLQAAMLDRYKAFWGKYILPGVPPEPQNYDDIKRLFPEPKRTLIVNEAVERMLSEYAQINKELKGQEKRQEEIKVKALSWARNEAGGVIDDESTEALILRNGSGDKVGSFSKNKNGALTFRA